MPTPDANLLDPLDRYWDSVARREVVPPADLDPDLAAAVRNFHDLRGIPAPEPDFADRLREDLLRSPVPASTLSNGIIVGNDIVPPATLYRPVARVPPRRRWWPPLEFAAAAVLIVGLLGLLIGAPQLSGLTGLWQQTDPTPAASDVPMFRGNPAGAGEQAGPGPAGEPVLRWRFETQDAIGSSPAVVGDTVYVGSWDGHVYAVDTATGAERWRFAAGSAVWASPAVVDGTLYVTSNAGVLFAITIDSPDVRAPTVADGIVYLTSGDVSSNNPAVADGVVYAGGGLPRSGGDESFLYAVEAATGVERWRLDTSEENALYAVDATTGIERWRFPKGVSWNAPAVAEGLVYAGHAYNGPLYAIDTTTGVERWRYDGGGEASVVVDGTVYANGFAVDAGTGIERWRFKLAMSALDSTPAVVDGIVYIYIGSGDASFYALDAATGTESWRFLTGINVSSPAVTGGGVYIGSLDGSLYAIEGSLAPATPELIPTITPTPELEPTVTPTPVS